LLDGIYFIINMWVKNDYILMKSGEYRLLGKSALLTNETVENVMLDMTERENIFGSSLLMI